MLAAAVGFALTALAIAAGRPSFLSVDRPAAALPGAVLMVAAGVLTPGEAGRAADGETIGLLAGILPGEPARARPSRSTTPPAVGTLSGIPDATFARAVALPAVPPPPPWPAPRSASSRPAPRGGSRAGSSSATARVVTGSTLAIGLGILLLERSLKWR